MRENEIEKEKVYIIIKHICAVILSERERERDQCCEWAKKRIKKIYYEIK